MTRLISALSIVLLAFPLHRAHAQQKEAPEAPNITLAHEGAKKAYTDLEALLKLANKQQQNQWKVIKANLDIFVIGIDEKRPMRMDLIFPVQGPMRYRPSFPIANLAQFRKRNLGPFGITTLRVLPSLYRCKGTVFEGYMRDKFDYATFGETKDDLPIMFNPATKLNALLMNHDVAMQLTNDKADVPSIQAREKWFKSQRKELVAALKKNDKESTEDFEFRKFLFEHQLDEMRRFYAETAELTAGWNMDLAKMTGQADLELTAIPGTPLEKSVDVLGEKPSAFANVPRSKAPILSMRVNWPLDDMRKASLQELFAKVRARQTARIDAGEGSTDEQKAAEKKIAGMVEQLLTDNAKAAIADLFVNVRPAGDGKNLAVGAFRTADGRKMLDILKELPKTHICDNVKMNVAKQGDVEIHQLSLKLSANSPLKMLLGSETVFVGTSRDACWFASGPKAQEELTAAIKETEKPNGGKASDPFFDLFVKMGPWLELRDKAVGEKEGRPEIRKLARDAFKPGNDGLTIQLAKQEKKKIVGDMKVETDVLSFVAAMIARFSAENLDDNNPANKKKGKKKLKLAR